MDGVGDDIERVGEVGGFGYASIEKMYRLEFGRKDWEGDIV